MQNLNISYHSLRQQLVFLLLLFSGFSLLHAEGIQQAAPNPPEDGKPPVMLIINSDEFGNFGTRDSVLSRLYFTIKEVGEMVHMGLSAPYSRGGNVNSEDSYSVRIYRDNTTDPLISFNNINELNANVSNYQEAAFGQYADIYNFAPTEPGNYFIEFQLDISDGEDDFFIGYWDFTVTDGAGANAAEIPGRVWSRNWAFRTPPDITTLDLETCGWNRPFGGVLYSYTGDDVTNTNGFVTKIDFSTSDFLGLSFNMAFNSRGPGTTGILQEDRKSIPGENQTAITAEYRIFLNPPDEDCFLSDLDSCGGIVSVGDVQCEGDNAYCVEVTVNQAGQIELLLDFEEGVNAAYVFDVLEPGTFCLPFSAIYGNGDPVQFNDNPILRLTYSQGVQHYAAFDVEFLRNGFCVETIRPICNDDVNSILNQRTRFLYWDDTMIPEAPLINYMNNNPPRDGREGFLCDGDTPRRWDNFTLLGECNPVNGTVFDGGTQGYGDSSTINTWWFAAVDTASIASVAFFDCMISSESDICGTTLEAIVAGGELPFIYRWSGPNGVISTEQSIIVSESGVYTLRVRDGTGCITLCSITITDIMAFSCEVDGPDTVCAGENATFSASTDGGTFPFSYDWVGPGDFSATSENITVSEAGEYCVTITDINGCQTECCETLMVTEVASCFVSGPDFICMGETTTYSADGAGFALPVTFEWSGPDGFSASIRNINISLAGEYCVTVTDVNGCQTECCKTLGLLDTPSCSVDGPAMILMGETTTYSANVSGGAAPYSYEWSGPNDFSASSESVEVSEAGEYCVLITDANGCMTTCCQTLSFMTEDIFCILEGPEMICTGDAASYTVVVNNGTAPFSFNWSGPDGFMSMEEVIEVSVTGEYCVAVTDADGMETQCCITLDFFDNPSCVIDGPDQICAGENTTYTASVSDGAMPFTYSWSGPGGFTATAENIEISQEGEYCVTIEDANGCTTQCCRTLIFFTDPSCIIDGLDQICFGETTTYTVNVTSANAPFVYEWSGPGGFSSSNESIEVSEAGEYCATVTDANGCQTQCCETLSLLDGPTCIIEGSEQICVDETAVLTSVVTSGPAPFNYNWSGPNGFTSIATSIEVTEAGEYCVMVTDVNGCQTECCQTLQVFESPSCTIEGPATIAMGETATYIVNASVGATPYTYEWTGPNGFTEVEPSIEVTVPGEYCATVMDANGCTTQCCQTLSFTADFSCLLAGPEIICMGDLATYTAVIENGTAPFSFNWSGPDGFMSMEESIMVSEAGEYCTTITDAMGVETQCCINLSVFDNPTCTVEGPDQICSGQIATYTANVVGDAAPFNYEWSGPGQFTSMEESIDVALIGEYCLIITDANGCQTQCCRTLNIFNNPSCIVEGPGQICTGQTATYTVTMTSGTVPFDYVWSGPGGFTAMGENIEVSEAGEYCVIVTDANGCQTECCQTLDIVEAPSCNVEGPTVIAMGETATYMASVAGGTAPFSYAWTGPDGFMANSEDIEVSQAGTYCLTATDANGCTTQCCQTLSFADEFSCVLVGPNIICEGDMATYTVAPTSGTEPFSYEWSGPGGFTSTEESIEVAEAGEYCVIITDANGLETQCCLMLSFFDTPSCMIDGPEQICIGETTIYTANVTSGVAPFAYEWSGPGGFAATSESVDVSQAGEYRVMVTDANGCQTECTKILDVIDAAVTLTTENTEIILGSEVTITATATACDNCTYEWTGPNGPIDEDGPIITVTPGLPLPTANEYIYSVVVSENGLCPGTDTITLIVATFCDADHIYLPNAFTPNGDDLNDELGILSNTLDLLGEVEFMIYNRWGEELFRTTNPKETWDGTYRGDLLPPDVYGYYLRVICPGTDEELVQKGNVTLLR